MVRSRKKEPSRPRSIGWNTTDEDEIQRRITRAREEAFDITSADGSKDPFSEWLVTGQSGMTYRVEIRSLAEAVNSCDCKDFQVNGLGTCKHIEAVLYKLRQEAPADTGRNRRIEIFLDRRDLNVKVDYPSQRGRPSRARKLVASYFDETGRLRGDPLQSMAALRQRLARESHQLRRQVRISGHLEEWLAQLQQAAEQREARRRFEEDLKQGRTSLDMVKLPLYPYQQEGMMHLAFTGRALLADEMGLGKTVQAIAGSELLDRLHGIEKVLVISPASLKTEWLEQISKFSDRKALIIQGMRQKRRQLYRQPAFFYLANYEQILHDKEFINEELKPDLIILDEAQRIKNWQTKTATAIKQLQSPYAFVLTGTPLENRIDEIYSIAQFLDPILFGPLFRFNREFHELDEKGRAVGYRNLDRLHERLRPVMLRRRKEEVEGELPPRSINNYFVPMTDAQLDQYREQETTVARLASLAKKRPLKKAERDRLMRALGCMRMACDTPYILDQSQRISPKLDELEKLLDDLLGEPQRKIIVFSEWERMLALLAERLEKSGIGHAWHTGRITQKRRRQEIERFRNSPDCRLFLATDSAATGLNLQVARTVINLDLPWNPAKLEQRIARAWRKHQKHPVTVINFISENTLEHRMLSVLKHKTALADEVIDGAGRVTAMEISGKESFMERLERLLAKPEPQPTPLERFAEKVMATHPESVTHLEQRGNLVLAVIERLDDELVGELDESFREQFGESQVHLEVLDQYTFDTLQRLTQDGLIQFTRPSKGPVYSVSDDERKAALEHQRRMVRRDKQLKTATEKLRMSQLLADGGFITEALVPMSEALNSSLAALAATSGIDVDDPPTIGQIGSLQTAHDLPPETIPTIAILRHESDGLGKQAAQELLASAREIANTTTKLTLAEEAPDRATNSSLINP